MDKSVGKDEQEKRATFLKGLCCHMVSITGDAVVVGQFSQQPQFFTYAGFVVSIRHQWLLVTAGHILKELDDGLKNKLLRLQRCELVDYYGLNAKSDIGIPFDFANATKLYWDDDKLGLDIGLVQIEPHYRRLMETNGVTAIAQDNWRLHEQLDFEWFGVLGLPDELLVRDRRIAPSGGTIAGGMRPVLMVGDQIEAFSDEKPTPISPWLAIKLRDKDEIKSLKGMSGGPIFGFFRSDKKLLYTTVAVQSWWDKKRRIAFGTSLPPVMDLFESALDSRVAEASG